ncbi:MAG: hypothetical protein VKK32_06175 [Candidatus Melainabacteria bacterium]|nr:hypothetical protein [Candidatus Melainabacteria bacterium]
MKIESNPLDLAVHKAGDDICSVFIVCDLNPEDLGLTLKFLNSFSSEKSLYKIFSVVSLEEFLSWGLDFNPSAEILCLHLSLDNEIKNHKLISDHAFKLGLKQLNPYNSLAELFDNKFLFYNFMLAQGFKQAKTYYLGINYSKTEVYDILDGLAASGMDSFLIKPCSGTESIDQYAFKLKRFSLKLDSIIEKITMIQKYDSLLIQEKLEFKQEYKIVFLYESIFSAKALSEKILAFCLQLLAAFKDYACLKSEFMPDVFSIDLLELASEDLVILEANARPAGIFKCVKHFYYLGDF